MRFNFGDGRMCVNRMQKDEVEIEIEGKNFSFDFSLSYWEARTLQDAMSKALQAPGPKGEEGYIKYGDDELELEAKASPTR